MTPLPVVKGEECITALQRAGFIIKRQKGSHVIMKREDPHARVVVPSHRKPLKPGTLRQIIREAGLTVEEFTELLAE
ncbi:MAG: type II toxin-antitoxin system HicA family toxin [Anaerolineae bacterium]|nr:type II toxin-antitoxin system HicA family toxin [Anaerolineae bacterium]